MTTLAELKEKVKEMEQAADRLLQVTKDLRKAVSVPWIKGHFTGRLTAPAQIRETRTLTESHASM